jgi:hypothetical protein
MDILLLCVSDEIGHRVKILLNDTVGFFDWFFNSRKGFNESQKISSSSGFLYYTIAFNGLQSS